VLEYVDVELRGASRFDFAGHAEYGVRPNLERIEQRLFRTLVVRRVVVRRHAAFVPEKEADQAPVDRRTALGRMQQLVGGLRRGTAGKRDIEASSPYDGIVADREDVIRERRRKRGRIVEYGDRALRLH
jgi:hypothetical protein